MKSTLTVRLLSITAALFASVSYASFTSNGVEIGNGKKLDDRGGFEIGNGSLANDVYRLSKIVGTWRVEMLSKFTGLTAVSNEPVKARGDLDVQKMERIQTIEDLVRTGEEDGWTKIKLGNAEGIKRESVSMSGIREITLRIFHSPGHVIKITLVGSERMNATESFKNLQKTLESLEVITAG